MTDRTKCEKCGRELVLKLENGRWHKYDKFLEKKHSTVCVDPADLYKVHDQIIAFWLKSTRSYIVADINDVNMEYKFISHEDDTRSYKIVDYVSAKRFCKPLDRLYKLIYL